MLNASVGGRKRKRRKEGARRSKRESRGERDAGKKTGALGHDPKARVNSLLPPCLAQLSSARACWPLQTRDYPR